MSLQTIQRIPLGNIGENLPVSEFGEVTNLNTLHGQFPIFDHIAQKNGVTYIFSTKARKRYGSNGKINSSYNVLYNQGDGVKGISRKFKKALELLKKFGYDTTNMKFCFLIAPIEEGKDCIYYWGEFSEINPECTRENILGEKIKRLAVCTKDSDLQKYKLFGTHRWTHIASMIMKN